MSYIEKLKHEVDALSALLADPHPDAGVWCAAVDRCVARIRLLSEGAK